MGVQITMPGKKDDSSMGRRLIGMAAPIVGGIFGGPLGAAAGGVLGAKLTGSDGKESLMAGVGAGLSQWGDQQAATQGTQMDPATKALQPYWDKRGSRLLPEVAGNSFSRRLGLMQRYA